MKKFTPLLLFTVFIGCFAEIDESKCYNTPEAGKTLYDLYKNCRKASESRQTKCMNVIDHYCTDVEYAFVGKLLTTGIMRSIKRDSNEVSISCLKATYKGPVEMSSFCNEVPTCHSLNQIQSKDCLLAVHMYCQRMKGHLASGFAYSMSSTHAIIACYKAAEQTRVPVNELVALSPHCDDVSGSASSDCFEAACKWCENKGYSGGITQGSDDSSSIIVSCYEDHFHKWVKVKSDSRFN